MYFLVPFELLFFSVLVFSFLFLFVWFGLAWFGSVRFGLIETVEMNIWKTPEDATMNVFIFYKCYEEQSDQLRRGQAECAKKGNRIHEVEDEKSKKDY